MNYSGNATLTNAKFSTTANANFQVSQLDLSLFVIDITFNYLVVKTMLQICTETSPCDVQESSEEKTQQLKNRLARLFEANERRCSRSVLYGADLLRFCTLNSEAPHSTLTGGGWRWVGRESCLRAQRTCMASTSILQSILHSTDDCHMRANKLIKRYLSSYLCIVL